MTELHDKKIPLAGLKGINSPIFKLKVNTYPLIAAIPGSVLP